MWSVLVSCSLFVKALEVITTALDLTHLSIFRANMSVTSPLPLFLTMRRGWGVLLSP